MDPQVSLVLFCLVASLFGIIGGVLARNRGRNILIWAIICAIFPVLLLVVWYEKPTREVKGGFRKCRSCGEYYPWQRTTCKYCGAPSNS